MRRRGCRRRRAAAGDGMEMARIVARNGGITAKRSEARVARFAELPSREALGVLRAAVVAATLHHPRHITSVLNRHVEKKSIMKNAKCCEKRHKLPKRLARRRRHHHLAAYQGVDK